MILADTNVWLALALSKHLFNEAVRDWFDQQSHENPVAFCRSTQQSFLRLLTTEGVMRLYGIPPMTNATAWTVCDRMLSDRRTGFVEEPRTIGSIWKEYGICNSASPKLWMDAYLAAFATAGGHKLVTTDAGFRQFKPLDLILLSR